MNFANIVGNLPIEAVSINRLFTFFIIRLGWVPLWFSILELRMEQKR